MCAGKTPVSHKTRAFWRHPRRRSESTHGGVLNLLIHTQHMNTHSPPPPQYDIAQKKKTTVCQQHLRPSQKQKTQKTDTKKNVVHVRSAMYHELSRAHPGFHKKKKTRAVIVIVPHQITNITFFINSKTKDLYLQSFSVRWYTVHPSLARHCPSRTIFAGTLDLLCSPIWAYVVIGIVLQLATNLPTSSLAPSKGNRRTWPEPYPSVFSGAQL